MAHSGPGKIEVVPSTQQSVIARLYNFDIARHELKQHHQVWLRQNVVAMLKNGGSLWITGIASPSDTDDFNLGLSRRRADAVIHFLRKESGPKFTVAFEWAAGEGLARAAGIANGKEVEYWRGVILSVWDRPTPPPPPPPPIPVIITPPKWPKRKVKITFFSDRDESCDIDMPRSACELNKWSRKRMDEKYFAAVPLNFETQALPESYQVVRIVTQRIQTDFNVGLASNSTMSCRVFYQWGTRGRPCYLLHGYWKDTRAPALIDYAPSIYETPDDWVDLWLRDPRLALKKLRNDELVASLMSLGNYIAKARALNEPEPPQETGWIVRPVRS
jgi:hypothetical protein